MHHEPIPVPRRMIPNERLAWGNDQASPPRPLSGSEPTVARRARHGRAAPRRTVCGRSPLPGPVRWLVALGRLHAQDRHLAASKRVARR